MMARCMMSGYSRCPSQATYRIKGWGMGFDFCDSHITHVVKTLRIGWDLVEEIPQQEKPKKIYPATKSNKQTKNRNRKAG
ncbi:hypothetical protein BRL53_09105 [Corynebacterium ulcerans]|nr:hypothetical protein BRL53_09105 [Corynebacterium ulcerans]